MSKSDSKPLIIALDFPDMKSALELARCLSPQLCRIKVGKELFTRAGPAVVEALQHLGFEVFLDLKFHDIPNTVASACKAAADLGVWMINVHAMGGRRMLEAAREAVDGSAGKPLLIAVSVLTSMSDRDLKEVGFSLSAGDLVMLLTDLAQASGLDGMVCSAREAKIIKDRFGEDVCLVTPGIRPSFYKTSDDQRRVLTPAEALAEGSDYLVIGRPVTAADDPLVALQAIVDEIA